MRRLWHGWPAVATTQNNGFCFLWLVFYFFNFIQNFLYNFFLLFLNSCFFVVHTLYFTLFSFDGTRWREVVTFFFSFNFVSLELRKFSMYPTTKWDWMDFLFRRDTFLCARRSQLIKLNIFLKEIHELGTKNNQREANQPARQPVKRKNPKRIEIIEKERERELGPNTKWDPN